MAYASTLLVLIAVSVTKDTPWTNQELFASVG